MIISYKLSCFRIAFLYTFLWLLTSNVVAQALPFVNFTTEDGLPSDETYEVFEDSKGYIWIATDRGIARYNGYDFKVFTTEDGLPDNTIFNFYEDKKKRLWFFTFNGKLGFYHEEQFHELNLGKENIFTLLNSIYVSPQDKVYVRQRTTSSEHTGFLSFNLVGNDIDTSSLHLYKDHELNDELNKFKFNAKMKAKHCIITKENELISTIPSSEGIKIGFEKLNGEISEIEALPKGKSYTVTSIGKLDSTFYLTTKDGYIIEYELKKPYKQVKKNFIDGYSLSNILRDSYGGLWISSLNKGVLYSPNPSINTHFIPKQITTQGLKKFAMIGSREVIVDSYDKIYLADKGPYQKIGSLKTNIEDLIQQDSTIYIQSHGAVATINRRSFFIGKELKGHQNSYLGYTKLEGNHKGNVSCGSKDLMLNESIFKINGAKRLFCLKQQGNTLWLGGMNGLFAFSISDKKQIDLKRDDLLLNRINYLELLGDYLLIATRGNGLLIKNGADIFQIKEEDGLVNNALSKIVIDSNNTVWISSNSGISKITFQSFYPLSYEIQNLGREDGLLSKKINDIQLFEDTLYIITTNQLLKLEKGYISSNKAPLLYLKQLRINNTVHNLSQNKTLEYHQNNIEISYEGLYYSNPKELFYQYSMDEGKTWIKTKNRSISFYGLSYGNYRLQLKAVTSKNLESEIEAFQFSIKTPFWAKWWFLGTFCSIFFVGIYLYVRSIIKKGERDNKIQSELYKLENKALISQMNPHFIFNALTTIQHYIIKKDKYEAYNYLNQFAKLIRAILKNSEAERVPLQEELDLLENYLNLEQIRFENKFDYTITINAVDKVSNIHIPSMLIQPYVENSIRHGFFHKEGVGKLEISLTVEDNVLICIIQDNGVGREKSNFLKKDKQRKSFGMSINERRLELLNQLYQRNLSLKIEDLYKNGLPLGTKVTLYIPVHPT